MKKIYIIVLSLIVLLTLINIFLKQKVNNTANNNLPTKIKVIVNNSQLALLNKNLLEQESIDIKIIIIPKIKKITVTVFNEDTQIGTLKK